MSDVNVLERLWVSTFCTALQPLSYKMVGFCLNMLWRYVSIFWRCVSLVLALCVSCPGAACLLSRRCVSVVLTLRVSCLVSFQECLGEDTALELRSSMEELIAVGVEGEIETSLNITAVDEGGVSTVVWYVKEVQKPYTEEVSAWH